MDLLEKLKLQPKITRQDVADLLKSIGKPGEKREEKIIAVRELDKQNFQGIKLEDSLNSYTEW